MRGPLAFAMRERLEAEALDPSLPRSLDACRIIIEQTEDPRVKRTETVKREARVVLRLQGDAAQARDAQHAEQHEQAQQGKAAGQQGAASQSEHALGPMLDTIHHHHHAPVLDAVGGTSGASVLEAVEGSPAASVASEVVNGSHAVVDMEGRIRRLEESQAAVLEGQRRLAEMLEVVAARLTSERAVSDRE